MRMSLAHIAKGKISRLDGPQVVFNPRDTNYQLYLEIAGVPQIVLNEPVDAVLNASARKVYTVPSGGLFVSPIVGTPRILQGRVKEITDGWLTLNCGVIVNVQLPDDAGAVELANGEIAAGSLVNVVLQPGASFTTKV
ncbi:MAG: hypothetical protein H7144_09865 [Burkholderiales bacterium]|nr:hypothetical protein [Phycisphaerae bacterium]